MFANLNIKIKIIKIDIHLNTMLRSIFNDNKNIYELLNMFKNVINNNDERMRFRMREIKKINNDIKKSNHNII